MSKPINDHQDPFLDTMQELNSAISALNMEASPLSAEEISKIRERNQGYAYLSETDKWAAHAMEHLSAAIKNLERCSQLYLDLKNSSERSVALNLDKAWNKLSRAQRRRLCIEAGIQSSSLPNLIKDWANLSKIDKTSVHLVLLINKIRQT